MAVMKLIKRAYIYGITDEHGTVRYVGKSVDVARRFKDHLSEKERNYPVYTWLRKQIKENREVSCFVIASVIVEDWQTVEKTVIRQYRDEGHKLLNLADGGDEPFMTLEQRKANAAKIKCPLHVRQENGRKVYTAIRSDPVKARIHKLRLILSRDWKLGLLPEDVKSKLKEAAATHENLKCFHKMAMRYG